MRPLAVLLLLALAAPASAQESRVAADWRREREHIAENCTEADAKKLMSCAVTLATDYPVHVALGSLAPQNGFAFGLAFVERLTPSERWKISFNADAVASFGGSWRAGLYTRFIRTAVEPPVVVVSGSGPARALSSGIHEYPVYEAYLQGTSLETLSFHGPGPAGPTGTRAVFGERQVILGARALVPFGGPLRASLIGAANGRFVRLRPGEGDVPAVGGQPAFLQLQEGVRVRPSLAGGRLRLDYLADFQQFIARDSAGVSFHRWTIDLRHEVPLYRAVTSPGPVGTNGPDECFVAVGSNACPTLAVSRNRTGALGLRLKAMSNTPFAGHRVPFYFQPTLGGSNIDGERLLAAYDDYRFRGPHLLVLQETFEHSVWGPIGAYLLAEQGAVAARRGDLGFAHLETSVGAGVSIRAAGLPVMTLAFAWGGNGGTRVIATMDASLLGGGGRPSLF